MTTPLDLWLQHFQEDPKTTWEQYVLGNHPIPGYERADVADTLKWVFQGGNPQLLDILDQTLIAWFDEFLSWKDNQRRQFGLSRYVMWLIEVMTAASLLKLPGFTRHVYDNLLRYRGMLTPLLLAPHRDPVAALYWVLSGSSEFAPALRHFWLRMCQDVDVTLQEYYMDIALQGLRQLPVEAGQAPPWLVGLLCWLPHARQKNSIVNTFRTLRSMYPRGPEQWRKWMEPLLENLKGRIRDPERLTWLEHELGNVQPRKQPGIIAPRYEHIESLFDQYNADKDLDQLRYGLNVLLHKHEKYLESTGDSYYYIRAVSNISATILKGKLKELVSLALNMTRRAIMIKPWDIHNWNLHGRCLAALGRYQAAEYIYWETLRRQKGHIPSMTELGRLMVVQERYDEAEAIFREALEIDPDNYQPRNELGLLLERMNRLEEAEAHFKEANCLFPWDLFFREGLKRLQACRIGEKVPAMPEPDFQQAWAPHQDASPTEHAYYEFLLPAALAKRHDFFIEGHGFHALQQQARQDLATLVEKEGQHVVVRFYGRRHGMILEGDEYGELNKACLLDRADSLTTEALGDLAQNLPTRLAELVKLAAGHTEMWPRLLAWREKEQNRQESERERTLSHLEQFILQTMPHDQEPPSRETLCRLLRQAAEIITPAGTELLVA